MGQDQAMDKDGESLEDRGWVTDYMRGPTKNSAGIAKLSQFLDCTEDNPATPTPHILLDTALARLDDLIRVARIKSEQANGAVVNIPIKAFRQTLAIIKVQVPPGTNPRDAKVWWEKNPDPGCFR